MFKDKMYQRFWETANNIYKYFDTDFIICFECKYTREHEYISAESNRLKRPQTLLFFTSDFKGQTVNNSLRKLKSLTLFIEACTDIIADLL